MTEHLKECSSTTHILNLQPNTALVKFHGGLNSILYVKSDECTDCAWWPECRLGNISQVLFQSVYPSTFKIENDNQALESHYFFENQGVYSVFIQGNKLKTVCYKQPFYPNLALYLIPLAILLPFILDFLLLLLKRVFKRPNDENGDQDHPPEPRRRYGSIDAARGLAMAWMIFVNYHGGSIPFMKHAAWHGFTFADFVFPFFLFIVGASYSLTITKLLDFVFTRKMLLRAGKLFFIGILLNNASSWSTLHILGVLQRIALAHIVFHFIRVVIGRMTPNYAPVAQQEELLYVSPGLHKEFTIVSVLALITTFIQLLPAEGCPSLYLGPGGTSENGTHYNCTGGFARYIDHIILGDSHMYQWPTCKAVYHTIVPFDPEGILGTFLAVGNIFSGFYAVYKLREPWAIARKHISITSIMMIVSAFILHFTVLPINKNLWTLSFVFLTSGLSQVIFLGLYYAIDISGIELPVLQTMGKYPLTLYIFHELAEGRFPVNWAVAPDPISQFLMSAYGVLFHSILAWVLSCGIFV